MVDDSEVDTVRLETISYARLVAQEAPETAKLLKAAESPGFFYLDLQDGPAGQMLADVQDIYPFTEQYFDQPHEVKMEHYREDQERGYKPGEADQNFEIARDEIGLGTLALPPVFKDNLDLLSRVSSVGYAVTRTILTRISSALKLSPATLLEDHHRDDEPSNTGLKLYYEPAKERVAEVAENWHTDGGTLTLLFCDQWGLYMEEPASKKRGFVPPVPGCAVVNVADSLQRLSRGRLHSCRHQVIQPVDGFRKRYFVVYFLRPELSSS